MSRIFIKFVRRGPINTINLKYTFHTILHIPHESCDMIWLHIKTSVLIRSLSGSEPEMTIIKFIRRIVGPIKRCFGWSLVSETAFILSMTMNWIE